MNAKDSSKDAGDANAERRHFLIGSAVVGAGLILGLQIARRYVRPPAGGKSLAPNAFVQIAPDDSITITIGKSEMGQGVHTGLPTILAEELDVDPRRVKVAFAPVAKAFFHPLLPAQFTGGSMSVQTTYQSLRQAGATARSMLLAAAAKHWSVDAAQLRSEDGVVFYGSKRLSYGELADAAAAEIPPEKPVLKDPSSFKYIGKPVARLDSLEKVTGRARFGLDVDLPEMLTAMVARGPVFGAKVRYYDASAALQVPGVAAVKQVPSGVAVLANNTWAARLGRDALRIDWDRSASSSFDSASLSASYRSRLKRRGLLEKESGNLDKALRQSGARVLDAEYEVPFLAHACMEPLNCVVDANSERCEIWAGTQNQSQDAEAAAAVLGLKPEQVIVHTTFLGGGFGRRASTTADWVAEAAHVAKGVGRPVKVVWTREDDMQGGYYRPFSVSRVRAAVTADGSPLAWAHSIVNQPVLASSPFAPFAIRKDGLDPTSLEGSSNMPYEFPNTLFESHNADNPVPILWWRSVGNSITGFVVNAAIDELAALAGSDGLQLRRRLLANKPRHLAVLNKAAEAGGWGRELPSGHHHGIALHESFGSIVAQLAEVSVSDGAVRVHRVTCAVDCGLAINPDLVRAQMESGIIYGLSAALRGEITLKDGVVQQSNFDDYPVLRMSESPAIDTHIVNSDGPLGGIGEPGTPPIASAVCAAVYAATGKRIRRLPIEKALAEA
jgi:isoquinoline 1-oxidoreductase beta subunit